MAGRLEYAKLLKQIVWNKPTFSTEGFLVTQLNMDKEDSSSFFYKEEEGIIECVWMAAKHGTLLVHAVDPLSLIVPAVIEKKDGKWVANKEESAKARKDLQERRMLAIQIDPESHPLMHRLSSFLQERKAFISGTVKVLRTWDPALEKKVFDTLENVLSSNLEDVSFNLPIGSIRRVERDWETLQYTSPTQSSSQFSPSRKPKTYLSGNDKLKLIIELIGSEEMQDLANLLRENGYELDYQARFNLACELVNGQTMAVLRELSG